MIKFSLITSFISFYQEGPQSGIIHMLRVWSTVRYYSHITRVCVQVLFTHYVCSPQSGIIHILRVCGIIHILRVSFQVLFTFFFCVCVQVLFTYYAYKCVCSGINHSARVTLQPEPS